MKNFFLKKSSPEKQKKLLLNELIDMCDINSLSVYELKLLKGGDGVDGGDQGQDDSDIDLSN